MRAHFQKKGKACGKRYSVKHVGRGKMRRKMCIPKKKKSKR